MQWTHSRRSLAALSWLSAVCLSAAAGAQTNPSVALVCEPLSQADLQSLSLSMALDNALCNSPVMRQAMLAIAEQRAGVDLANTAYGPKVNLGAQTNASRNAVPGLPNQNSQSLSSTLGLSWVLFDFGLRDANLAQAQAQLTAAMAGMGSTQLLATSETVRLYVDALTAWLRQNSLREAEAVAAQSAKAAAAKYEAQVGALSEKLQAETALAQSTLDRVRAEGQWESARAALVVQMGYPITQRLAMPTLEVALPFVENDTPVDTMLAELRERHPRLLALQAEAQALRSRQDAITAQGRGTVTADANVRAAKTARINGLERSAAVGVVANIPLLNGREQDAQLAQNSAQTQAKLSQVEAARRELETELLRNVITVRTEIETRLAGRALLKSAVQNHEVALGRYRAGVGTIVDLLNAQAAVSAARFTLDQSYMAQASARLRMASAAGRLPSLVKNTNK
jgi:outer membrane protein